MREQKHDTAASNARSLDSSPSKLTCHTTASAQLINSIRNGAPGGGRTRIDGNNQQTSDQS
jgi:hypothetical protein